MQINWGALPPEYNMGIDRGVLYLQDRAVPWSGLVSVDSENNGAIEVEHYFDGLRINISEKVGDFKAKVSAFTYPSEFDSPQESSYGFSYRSQVGENRYQIHLVYEMQAKVASRNYRTVAGDPDPSLFVWDISTNPLAVPGSSPSAHLVIESVDEMVLSGVEDILYGSETSDPSLPSPEELYGLYEANTALKVTYLGDGMLSIEGPDEMVQVDPDGTITINAPTAFTYHPEIVVISSY